MSKINSKILLLILAAFIFSACSQNKKTEEQYLTSAKTIVDSAQAKNDQNLFKEGIKTYEEFLKEYPNSSNAVAASFSIANIYNDNLRKMNKPVSYRLKTGLTEYGMALILTF